MSNEVVDAKEMGYTEEKIANGVVGCLWGARLKIDNSVTGIKMENNE